MKKAEFKKALRDTFPVMTGYLVLGFGFGIIMKTNGYGVLWSAAISLFVYAGSMQYAAIGLLSGGASLLTVALTTLAVNARHLFYGISMVEKYKGAGKKKAYMIFALTDETYSLVCSGKKTAEYCFYVSLLDHFYWVTGSVAGALFGTFVKFDTSGMDFALTALFITVFTGQWLNTKKHFPALAGVIISVICLLIFGKDGFLIPSMAFIAAAMLLVKGKESLYD